MLRKPGSYDPSTRASRGSRRKVQQETPDEIIRRLQRLGPNKKCADCSAKLPQVINLTYGTFVCFACSGLHREFNHRIKGIGHSSFNADEAAFMTNNGNEVANKKYFANYNAGSERLRAPDGGVAPVDGQLMRVWLRRKYIDKAWVGATQPTRVQIPPKKKKTSKPAAKPAPTPAPAAGGDLLGGWDAAPVPAKAAPPAPTSTPVVADDAWDAFGKSRSSVGGGEFADFGSQGTTQQPAFQPTFESMPPQQPPMPQQQQPQPSLNANFQSQEGQFQPSSQTNFQPPQQQPNQQQMQNGRFQGQQQERGQVPQQPSFNGNFQSPQQQQSKLDQRQQVQVPQQPSFDANFQSPQQQPNGGFQGQVPQQPSFGANFQSPQQQQQQIQAEFHTNIEQQSNQQVQQEAPAQSHNQSELQFVQQQQQNQQMNGFNPNFQQQQQQIPPQQYFQQVGHEQNNGFNANFQQQTSNTNGMHTNNMQPPQQTMEQPKAQTVTSQQGFSTNFQQQPTHLPPGPPPPQPNNQTEQTHDMTNGFTPQQETKVEMSPSNNEVAQQTQESAMTTSTNDVSSEDPFSAFDSLSLGLGIGKPSMPSAPVHAPPEVAPQNIAAKTQESVTISSRKYSIGQVVEYRDSQQNVTLAKVMRVHLDNNLVPFYDIQMSDGRERQTDDGHLNLPSMQNDVPSTTEHKSRDLLLSQIKTSLDNLDQVQLQNVNSYIQSILG